MAISVGADVPRPCAECRIYNLRLSAVGELKPSKIPKINLGTSSIHSFPLLNGFNTRSASHFRREPLPGPSTTTSPYRNIPNSPDSRRRCHRSHHRLGPPRSRLPYHGPCLTLGFLHRRATANISNRRRVVGIPPSSLWSAHRRNLPK